MATLLDVHHNHFDARTGTFNSKPFAGIVAAQMGRYLPSAIGVAVFDSRNVQVIGKHEFTIEFPRIRHVWWPKDNTEAAIKAEIAEVVQLFQQELKE